MIDCALCLNKILSKNSIKIDTKDDFEATVEEIIKIHFWFSDTILVKKQPFICKTCWTKLESFHKFFCAVKFSHNVIETESEQQFNQVFVKSEATEEEKTVVEIKQDVDEDSAGIDNFLSSFQEIESEIEEPKPKKRKIKTKIKEKTQNKFFDVLPEELDVLRNFSDFKCEKCSTEMKDWEDMRNHYRQFHNTRGYLICCGKKIDRPSEIKEHAAWHLNPNIFQCRICGKSSISRWNLQLHEESHVPIENRKFPCPKCDKRFINKYVLKNHLKNHEKDGKQATIPCKFCNKLFKSELQLKGHVNYCHKEKEETWICHICSKVLKNKSSLESHEKDHTNSDSRVECDLCGSILKNKRRFLIHFARHKSAAAGPYLCEKDCGKLFRNRYAMFNHIRFVHTENRFKCSSCEKVFKHKKTLRDHELSQHAGIDLYACPFCDRTFKNNGNMHKHKKNMHPEMRKTKSCLRGII